MVIRASTFDDSKKSKMSDVDRVRLAVGVAAFCFACLIGESAAECKNTLVTECTRTFSSRHSKQKFIFPKEERESACQDLQRFVSCFEATGCHHTPVVEPVYDGFKRALNFTCNETNHRHEQVATCWQWNGFDEAQQFCYEMFLNRSEGPNCEDRSNTFSCLVKSVDKCCGKESAAYAQKSISLLLEPILMMSNCMLALDEDVIAIDECSLVSAPSGLNIGLIFIIIFVVIIIVVVVVVVVIIVKRKSASHQWASM